MHTHFSFHIIDLVIILYGIGGFVVGRKLGSMAKAAGQLPQLQQIVSRSRFTSWLAAAFLAIAVTLLLIAISKFAQSDKVFGFLLFLPVVVFHFVVRLGEPDDGRRWFY